MIKRIHGSNNKGPVIKQMFNDDADLKTDEYDAMNRPNRKSGLTMGCLTCVISEPSFEIVIQMISSVSIRSSDV
nr:hypothetical protein [Tanacetum cinerariifolium]